MQGDSTRGIPTEARRDCGCYLPCMYGRYYAGGQHPAVTKKIKFFSFFPKKLRKMKFLGYL